MDGTASSNQVSLRVIQQPITNWLPGAAFWLVWQMNDPAAKGQGLAIDNLSFSASTEPPNRPPVLAVINDKFIYSGQTVHFTASATDTDQPPQTLTFTLDPGAPAAAGISSAGVFDWPATNAAFPSTSNITIRVTDNGTPPLSATRTFSVTILPLPQLDASRPIGTNFCLSFSTLAGQSYQVEYKDGLDHLNWHQLGGPVSGAGEILEVVDDMSGKLHRFYRLLVLP